MSEIIEYAAEAPMVMTLCMEEESILLNKSILFHLGQPRQVQLLINMEQHMLLLKACSTEDREAVVIPSFSVEQFEVSGASLLKKIRKLTGWGDMRPRQIYGRFIPEYTAITFDLNAAFPVILASYGEARTGRQN